MECERQGEGHAVLRSREDYTCSMCKHADFHTPVSTRMETEEREKHMHADTDTQPAQSDMDCEPASKDSTEPGQTVSEPRHEVDDVTEHKESGKIRMDHEEVVAVLSSVSLKVFLKFLLVLEVNIWRKNSSLNAFIPAVCVCGRS